MPRDAQQLYQQRLHRYVTACYNGRPDRIPIRVFAEELAAKYAGYSNFDTAVDHELQFEVNRKFASELGCDAIQGYLLAKPLPEAEALALLNGCALSR